MCALHIRCEATHPVRYSYFLCILSYIANDSQVAHTRDLNRRAETGGPQRQNKRPLSSRP